MFFSMKNKVPLVLTGLALLINSCNVGVHIGKAIERSEIDADRRLEQIQSHNRQIENQLIPTYMGLGNLILNDEDNTFEFRIDSTDYPDQRCTGEFEVQKNTAKAVGDVACTQVHKVNDK